MVFLFLFSYLIICDYSPLYDFPANTCPPAGDSKDNKDNASDKGDDKSTLSNLVLQNISNISASGSQGLQRIKRPSTIEFILLVWILSLACEEIRQVIYSDRTALMYNLYFFCLIF